MRAILFAAVAALALSAGAARAGEGNGDPFGLENARLPPVADSVGIQTAQEAYPRYSLRAQVAVTPGGVLPSNGSAGIVESAGSLPNAPEIGGVWPARTPQPAG